MPTSQQSLIGNAFENLKRRAAEERFIGNLMALSAEIDRQFNSSMQAINRWMEEKNRKPMVKKSEAMNIPFDKPMLETEADVDAYLEALRTKMMSFINQNKNIMLN